MGEYKLCRALEGCREEEYFRCLVELKNKEIPLLIADIYDYFASNLFKGIDDLDKEALNEFNLTLRDRLEEFYKKELNKFPKDGFILWAFNNAYRIALTIIAYPLRDHLRHIENGLSKFTHKGVWGYRDNIEIAAVMCMVHNIVQQELPSVRNHNILLSKIACKYNTHISRFNQTQTPVPQTNTATPARETTTPLPVEQTPETTSAPTDKVSYEVPEAVRNAFKNRVWSDFCRCVIKELYDDNCVRGGEIEYSQLAALEHALSSVLFKKKKHTAFGNALIAWEIMDGDVFNVSSLRCAYSRLDGKWEKTNSEYFYKKLRENKIVE